MYFGECGIKIWICKSALTRQYTGNQFDVNNKIRVRVVTCTTVFNMYGPCSTSHERHMAYERVELWYTVVCVLSWE